jgi:serine phosphatase RsbU (regulator of sigma subunit)
MLLVHADGITEAANATGGMCEERRLLSSIQRHKGRATGALVSGILDDPRRFLAGDPIGDDVALV